MAWLKPPISKFVYDIMHAWGSTEQFDFFQGADIAKKKFDVACLSEEKFKHKIFTRDAAGFAGFVAWILNLCGDTNPP
ncbi:MAG: hypothetical protein ACRESZ_06180 [Methylococcales bacterium]